MNINPGNLLKKLFKVSKVKSAKLYWIFKHKPLIELWALANKSADKEKIEDKKCDTRKCNYKHKMNCLDKQTETL